MDALSEPTPGSLRPGAVPRLERLVLFWTLVVGAAMVPAGALAAGSQPEFRLVLFILACLFFNGLLLGFRWRHISPPFIMWLVRAGNLILLTLGVSWTGGLSSPFFVLYAVYIVVASLRFGWRGTVLGLALGAPAWLILWLRAPLASLAEWERLAVYVAAFILLGAAAGAVAQRYLNTQSRLLRHDRELTFLREAGRQLSMSLDPQQVLAATLTQANELLGVEAASLALVDRLTGRITFELVIGGAKDTLEGLRLERGQGVIGRVIEQGAPLLVPDAAADPAFSPEVDQYTGYRTRSLLCVPLCNEGQMVGALEVVNKREGTFTEADMRLLSSLADLAAPAIQNARLHAQLRQNIEHLQEAYDEVRKLNETKSGVIRNLSHELRTPLALISGYVELLVAGDMGPLQPEQQESLAMVGERANALNQMVNDFISLQAVGNLGFDLEPLDIASLAQAVIDDARSRAEKARITLELDLPPDGLPPVSGDARRLRRVFDHLLDNAIKFSPNGGLVRVSLSCEGTMIQTRVQDQGIGLATDQLEQVFERFYQVDGTTTRRFGGMGLGLAFVKEVVEAHGGAVLAESDGIPGRGSTFSFFLPIAPTAPHPPATSRS